jgi:N-formylmaleamate deformylase
MSCRPSLGFLAALGIALCTVLALSCYRAPKAPAHQEATPALPSPEVPPFSVKVVGNGPPLLLLPGLASPGAVWDTTVAHLQERYTLHVFTLAGFGGQPARPGLTLEEVRASLVRYIREQKLEKPVVIGHSLGGFMAYWLGATAPDSVGPLVAVDGLPFLAALVDPKATAASTRSQAEQLRAGFRGLSHEQFLAGVKAGVGRQATGPEHQAQVVAWCAPSDPGAVGNAMAELLTMDLRAEGKAIRSPVLLMAAVGGVPQEMQAAVRAEYEAQVASIPEHQVVFLEHARHFVMLDDPQAFFAALDDFLHRTGR